MEIPKNSEALKVFLGVSSLGSAEANSKQRTELSTSQAVFVGDHATLSQAASEISQAVFETDVRMDRVSVIQRAITAGTYTVSPSKVADKVMDAMLTSGFPSN